MVVLGTAGERYVWLSDEEAGVGLERTHSRQGRC